MFETAQNQGCTVEEIKEDKEEEKKQSVTPKLFNIWLDFHKFIFGNTHVIYFNFHKFHFTPFELFLAPNFIKFKIKIKLMKSKTALFFIGSASS